MKNFALIAFALVGYWLISNPYNWPVFKQTLAVVYSEVIFDNVGPKYKEPAARFLARDEMELIKLKVLRDSVQ